MEQPYKGRATLTDYLTHLEITIPAKKNWFAIIFIGGWLGGWLLGEVFAISTLIKNLKVNTGEFFLLFWLIAWTAAGFFAIKAFLWSIGGKEIITVRQGQLTIDKKSPLFLRHKVYDLNEVKNIRIQDNNSSGYFSWHSNNFGGTDLSSSIKFDYGLRTIRFAGGLDETEANFIINKIKGKHKQPGEE